MVVEQLPLLFCRLRKIRDTQPNAIIISNAFDEVDSYIAAVLSKGLDSGSYIILERQIDWLFKSRYGTNKANVLANINVFFGKRENRIKLANLLLNSPEAIKKIQSGSYLHHNGFRKIVLLETKYFKLRLHVFEPIGQIIAQENVHDHRWPFASVCLKGDLVCRIYEMDADAAKEFEHYEYSPVGTSDSYTVHAVGSSRLSTSIPIIIQPGNVYYLPEKTLHRVINRSGERVITLVITGTPVKDTCNLYSDVGFDDEEIPVERFSEDEIENAVTELIHL